jgi:MoaA/NifB/PqqE/SkfB family radical SAM enzyme
MTPMRSHTPSNNPSARRNGSARAPFGRIKDRGGNPVRPTMIANFAVTYRCNGRCRTCNIWKMESPEQGEMSTRDVQGLFEDNRGFLRNVRSIQLTGGEPFLRGDLPELVSTIHNNLPGCTYWIPTNGVTPETVEKTAEMLEILEGQSLGISVSIDGLEETHDEIRGVEGSFRKAVEALDGLSSLRDRHHNLALSVGMTITKENYGEMPGVAHIAKHHGADFTFRPVNRSEFYYRNTAGAPSPAFIAEEILPSIQKVGRDLLRTRGLRASTPTLRYMQGALDYIRSPGRRSLPCSAASDSFFLDPYGNVYPCIVLDAPLGNALEKPLREIWESREAKTARETIRRGCCPGCWVECETFRDIRRDVKGLLSTAIKALLRPSTAGIR